MYAIRSYYASHSPKSTDNCLSLTITVLDKAKGTQRTVASIDMYVNLPRHYKGTHMSRFISYNFV